jgi:hypothetical protein
MDEKMGKGPSSFQTIMVLAVLALIGISGFGIYKLTADKAPAGSAVTPQQTSTGQIVTPSALVSCPSDGTTDGQVRYRDMLASVITYEDPVVYFVAKTSGVSRVAAGTLQTDGTYSTAVDLKCTEAGTVWQPVAVTKQDDAASAVGADFTAEGSYTKVELFGKDIDSLKFKVEDKFTGGAKYFNITAIEGGEGAYTSFNGTKAVVANGASTGTSLTLGTDGYIDSRIYLKTINTKRQFGEDGLRTFLLVDADGASWSEPIVSRDNGAKLSNVVDSLSSDDRRAYSGYEYAYEIGVIGDKETFVDFYLQSAAGVNPGATSDPTVEICAEGRYNSVKEQDAIKIGCWTDAASQAAVFTANRPYFSFDVA